MNLPQFAFFNGRIVPYSEAKVGILTHSLQYGTGVFGGLRGYWNEAERQLFLFRATDHFTRFLQSTKLLCMEFSHSPEDLTNFAIELLQAENYQRDCYLRPFAYFSEELIGGHPNFSKPGLSIAAIRFEPPVNKTTGLHASVSAWRRVDDSMIPARGKISGAYVNSFLAKTDAIRSGFDEAILLNGDGHVAEGSIMNLFLIRNRTVITPPVTDNILEGITRRSLITLLRDEFNMDVQERPIDRSELYIADEVFFCGTATQVAPVTRIDHRPVGNGLSGQVTSSLLNLYDDVLRGRNKKYFGWCLPVYGTL
jgi:branched-chain amino acid aminotransferase